MTADVTVVSCLYGTTHDRFVDRWARSLRWLNTKPTEVIVGCDRTVAERGFHIPGARTICRPCDWEHPQAFYLQAAILAARTEWVWILDMDDMALPDALDGLEDVTADVWVMGYKRSDGHHYVPPQLTASQYLHHAGNPFTGTSAFRATAFKAVGGFRDVAFQDYDLWLRMAQAAMTFKSSGRAHFEYWLHDDTRTSRELVKEKRHLHLAEIGL